MKFRIFTFLFSSIIIFLTEVTFSQVIFSEDFEGILDPNTYLPFNWTETGLSSDGIYMVGDNNAAGSAGSWNVQPHTLFAMTNDDECNCDKSADRLILPPLDLSSYSGSLSMTFTGVNDNQYSGITTLEVSLDGGNTWEIVETLNTSNGTDEWQNYNISLSQFLGNSNVLISFLYNDEGVWALGFAVDDISIFLGESSDNDGDGITSDQDCDDNNPNVFQMVTVYIDLDFDGYVSGDTTICMGNLPPDGFTLNPLGFDCNDSNPMINPGAFDIPDNGIDENCDGQDATSSIDNDGDGFTSDVDCDDNNPNINPGAFDIPDNGIDEDCDGQDATSSIDNDGDGFTSDVDCDDNNPNINPDATEIPDNGIDEDCNGEDLTSANNPPNIVNDNATCLTISSVDINILANDNDPDGNLVSSSIVITTQPSNGTIEVDFNTGVVTYTPNAGFVGTDSFCYTVCDNGTPEQCGQACVTIDVQNAEPPMAVDDNTTIFIGETTSISILLNDTDPNGNIAPWNNYTVDLDPITNGIQSVYVSSNPNATWTYNPMFQTVSFSTNDNSEGTYVMQYQLCDPEELCDIASVTVNVVTNYASINEIDDNKISISPNPFENIISIKNSENVDFISITTVEGKISKLLNNINGKINLETLTSGTYIFNIYMKNGKCIRKKIIKL